MTSAANNLPLSMIAAMARNRTIGLAGKLPWQEPEDLRHFQRTSTGHALIMGRRTADSLGWRALPKRRNIVISRQSGLCRPGFEVCPDLYSAVALARTSDAVPMVIGGGEVYRQALPLATLLYLTVVQREYPGDAFFPEFPEHAWWESEQRVSGALVFRTLVRIDTTLASPANDR
jgi:dihydrofolate reductase